MPKSIDVPSLVDKDTPRSIEEVQTLFDWLEPWKESMSNIQEELQLSSEFFEMENQMVHWIQQLEQQCLSQKKDKNKEQADINMEYQHAIKAFEKNAIPTDEYGPDFDKSCTQTLQQKQNEVQQLQLQLEKLVLNYVKLFYKRKSLQSQLDILKKKFEESKLNYMGKLQYLESSSRIKITKIKDSIVTACVIPHQNDNESEIFEINLNDTSPLQKSWLWESISKFTLSYKARRFILD